ncbi:hypothetical protein [Anaerosinus massiliensis]|uniref:hypothetical protein n=1 Tax=Massilibacillus massiliensis TaxID=1806837 RepID=UPI0018FED5FB|nr:hypothetical protein [Massilibacillus massiliensis]
MILFAVLSLLAIFFLKTQVYQSVDDHFESKISLSKVNNLSNTEIVEKLFTMYLEHYKGKSIFDNQRIKDYKNIKVTEEKYVTDGTAFSVSYLVQQHFWNEYWEVGGKAKDGMIRQFVFVSLIKEKDQFRLKLNGTAPPIPK